MSDTSDTGQMLASASMGASGFRVEVETEGRTIIADEPASLGGADEGPSPFGLLYAALSSCVLITIRMYARRKEWALEGASIRLGPSRRPGGPVESIRIELGLEGELTDEQRARLLDIAGKCPVHRTLEREVPIETRLVG